MATSATDLSITHLQALPKSKILYAIIPLILAAVWLAGIRPASDSYVGTVNFAHMVLAGGIFASFARKWLLTRLACTIALVIAAYLSLSHFASLSYLLPGPAIDSNISEPTSLAYITIATLLVSLRKDGTFIATLIIFILVQVIQFSAINAFSVVGNISEQGLVFGTSAFSATLQVLMALILLTQFMMRSVVRLEDARVWPISATAAAMLGIAYATQATASNFATIVAASSGFGLICMIFIGSAGAVTRSQMFRLHLSLRREVRKLTRKRELMATIRDDYRELLNNVPIGVMRTVEPGRILGANPRMQEILGFESEDDIKSVDLRALFEDPDERRDGFFKWLDSGELEWRGVAVLSRRDGANVAASFTTKRVNDQDGKCRYILSCYEDITKQQQTAKEMKKLETDMHLTHKLEAVGRLAAGVAHEINTPMQYIGDNVHFLASAYEDLRKLVGELTSQLKAVASSHSIDDMESTVATLNEQADLDFLDESVSGSFKRTLEGVRSVAEIVRSMKEFAYPNDKQLVTQDINKLLLNTLTVSRSMYSSVANIVTDLAELPPTACFPGELNQVFVNLVVNAAHAVENANTKQKRAMGEIRVVTRSQGEMIEIDIADDGCGMPSAVRERIFDPFFTTKAVGKGTGQGLAISRSIIVDKHEGTISVASEAGKGTTFTVCLPIRAAID